MATARSNRDSDGWLLFLSGHHSRWELHCNSGGKLHHNLRWHFVKQISRTNDSHEDMTLLVAEAVQCPKLMKFLNLPQNPKPNSLSVAETPLLEKTSATTAYGIGVVIPAVAELRPRASSA
ncbi:hypothetical protein TIFTF001_039759 [Ficus carica]|uniref:Uncharacterized protein n=1 Tax=Ficus carica TaxID=3494 RepID=A0AA87YP78_FICCA|nr:hypothetical protein TIFTF001_039759 [Ficus carica]